MLGNSTEDTIPASSGRQFPLRGPTRRFVSIACQPAVLAWAGFFLSLILLYRQIGRADSSVIGGWLNSDTLWQANVFTDIVRDHYSLSGWVFSVAPCWFPDLLATGIFWFVTQNVVLATLFAGFIQLALLFRAFHICRRALGLHSSSVHDAFVIATGVTLTLLVALHPGKTYPGLYQFLLPQTHVGNLLVFLYGLSLGLLLIKEKVECKYDRHLFIVLLYAVICFLGGMSDLLLFVHLLLPLSSALCFAVFLGALTCRQSYLPVAVGWVTAALGAIMNRSLFHVTSVSAKAGYLSIA